MHMSDALISPLTGGAMWVATAGLISYSAKQLKKEADDRKVPLMGVLGAFIFASQMINFSIPATGSSGHLGGGLLLAILLGPDAAFLVMASVLLVQALFFGDGGLLALGCNIFNLGAFPCFIAYPLIYRKIVKGNPTQTKITIGCLIASVIGLQLGAIGVVLETVFSGISELPFRTFVLLMQPIHLVIGIVEGLVTAAVVSFVWKARPEILSSIDKSVPIGRVDMKKILLVFVAAAAIIGGILSWFASVNPDSLEWAVLKASGQEKSTSYKAELSFFTNIQSKTAIFPDYNFKNNEPVTGSDANAKKTSRTIDSGTSVSGLIGIALTLLVIILIGLVLNSKRRKMIFRKLNHE